MQTAREVTTDRIEEVYRTRGAALLRSVLLFAGDREIANDAVAEAFAQAIRRGDELDRPEHWITKVAFKIASGELQRRQRHSYPLADESVHRADLRHERGRHLPEVCGHELARSQMRKCHARGLQLAFDRAVHTSEAEG